MHKQTGDIIYPKRFSIKLTFDHLNHLPYFPDDHLIQSHHKQNYRQKKKICKLKQLVWP